MPFAHIRRVRKTYSPASRATAETVDILPLRQGQRVLAVAMERLVPSDSGSTPTVAVQASATAGGAANGLMAATATAGAVGSLVNNPGTDLASSGGFLATASGTIQVVYTPGSTPGNTTPVVRLIVDIQDSQAW